MSRRHLRALGAIVTTAVLGLAGPPAASACDALGRYPEPELPVLDPEPPGPDYPGADRTPPTVQVIAPANGAAIHDRFMVQTAATDDVAVDHVELWIGNETAHLWLQSGERFFLASQRCYRDGLHHLHAQAVDTSGLASRVATIDLIIDHHPPVVAFTSGPEEGATVGPGPTTIGFTATDATSGILDAGCAVDDGLPLLCADSVTLDGLAPGPHELRVTAMDHAYNMGGATRHFTVAAPSPTSGHDAGAEIVATVTPPAPAGNPEPGVAQPDAVTANTATVTVRSRRSGAKTVLTSLVLRQLAAGTTLKLSCKGATCPMAPSAAKGGTLDLSKLFKKIGFKPGTVLTIRVTDSTHRPLSFKITFVKGKAKVAKS